MSFPFLALTLTLTLTSPSPSLSSPIEYFHYLCKLSRAASNMPGVQDTPLTLADLANLNYTILVPYNESIATGGDSLNNDLNVYYTVRSITGFPAQ